MFPQINYQALEEGQDEMINRISWKKFYVYVGGQTNGTHKEIIQMLKSSGHNEVYIHQDCDYCLVFCPFVSRLKSDISSALDNSPDGKPIILVVMHYHHDPEQTFGESHGSVENPGVLLTVDIVFYKHKLLKCAKNNKAYSQIRRFLSLGEESQLTTLFNCLKTNQVTVYLFLLAMILVVLILKFSGVIN